MLTHFAKHGHEEVRVCKPMMPPTHPQPVSWCQQVFLLTTYLTMTLSLRLMRLANYFAQNYSLRDYMTRALICPCVFIKSLGRVVL